MRHFTHFNPVKSPNVTVIGCGATGSKIAISLAKLGIQKLSIYDNDVIQSHNISNQYFGIQDIGKSKVEVLAKNIYDSTTLIVDYNNELFQKQTINGIVFLLTDTMKSRKEIVAHLRLNPTITGIIETRMGVDEGRVYCFNPSVDYQRWLEVSDYDDEQSEESACGSRSSIGPTGDIISGLAVWQYMKLINNQKPEFEVIFTIRPSIAFMTTS